MDVLIARFDKFNRFEKPTLTLCNPGSYITKTGADIYLNHSVGNLAYAKNIGATINFGSYSELNLTLPYHTESYDLYNGAEIGRYIYASDIGYFIINSVNDNLSISGREKEISCLSVERELEEFSAPFFKAGVYPLLDSDDKEGLIDLSLAGCPGWTLVHIDETVEARSRYFEMIDEKSVYEFFMNDIQESYDCVIEYDIMYRTISIYDKALYALQHMTDIRLSKANVLKELTITQTWDDLYTALNVTGDEDMNIRRVNPTGTNIIYNFDARLSWMSPELRDAVERWSAKIKSVEGEYVDGEYIEGEYVRLNREYYNAYLQASEYQMNIDRIDEQIGIYKTCRDSILLDALSPARWMSFAKQLITAGVPSETIDMTSVITLVAVTAQLAGLQIQKINAKKDLEKHQADVNESYNQIKAIQEACSLDVTARDINGNPIFTEELLRELSSYIKQADFEDENITKTDIMSQSEIFDQCVMLMRRAKAQLEKVSTPCRKFDMNTESFIFSDIFKDYTEQLVGGCIINVEVEEDVFDQLNLLTLDVDFEDKVISFTFGNRYNKYDPKSLFDDVFSTVSKSAATLKFVTDIMDDMNTQLNSASKWIENALTLTKDHALMSETQEVVIDSGGYLGRVAKISSFDDNGNPIYATDIQGNMLYDGEQIKIVNNCIVFTEDGWETASTAIGKIHLGTDDNGDPITKYGIIGEVIIGKILAGNNLIIAGGTEVDGDYSVTIDSKGLTVNNGDIVVKDPNGKKVFGVDESGRMFLDGSLMIKGIIKSNVNDANGKPSFYLNLDNGEFKASKVILDGAFRVDGGGSSSVELANSDFITGVGMKFYSVGLTDFLTSLWKNDSNTIKNKLYAYITGSYVSGMLSQLNIKSQYSGFLSSKSAEIEVVSSSSSRVDIRINGTVVGRFDEDGFKVKDGVVGTL